MLKILFGFAPWIVYSLIVSNFPNHLVIAILSVLVLTLVCDNHALKKGFILAWGTVVFFLFMLVSSYYIANAWLEAHVNVISNAALACITWFSLLINKPFTIQYAKEETPPEVWDSPLFMQINQYITAVWGVCFTLSVIANALQLYAPETMQGVYNAATYGFLILAIWFTKVFPEWFKQKQFNTVIARSEQHIKDNPFLKNNFAPMTHEYDFDALEIEGELPADLQGIYMRNGPNPQFPPFNYTYPLDGDGMLHALYFENGKVRYKNRFVLTDQLQVERRLGKAIYGGVQCPMIRDSQLLQKGESQFPVKLGRFIHIIRHGQVYLALHEASSAYQVDSELNTIGEWNPTQSDTAIEVNAHARLDPLTGQLFMISYFTEPVIRCHVLDEKAAVTESVEIKVPFASMIHDFVLTQKYIVLFLCPAVVDFSAIAKRQDFVTWNPSLKTHIAILERTNLAKEPQWIETNPFYVFHFANAYDQEGKIIVDYAQYPQFDLANLGPATLYRTVIDVMQKSCTHQQMNQHKIEFPRINEGMNSLPNRYIYCPVNSANPNTDLFDGVIKYDMQTMQSTIHRLSTESEIGEVVFVPKAGGNSEDDGYVMFFVYDNKEMKSHFLILDAANLEAAPLAKIKIPVRVPHGLHGSWFPG